MALTYHSQEIRSDATLSEKRASLLFSRTDRFDFTSEAGMVRTEVFSLADSSIRFGRVTSTGHEIELTEEVQATFLLPTRGRLCVQVVGREFETEEGSMLALRPHRRRTVVVPAGDRRYAALVMMMPLAQMARLSSTGRVPPFLHGRDGAILQGPEARRLQRYLEFMIADMLYDPSSEPPARTAQGVLSLVGDLLHDLSNAESQAGALQVRPISTRRVRGAEALLRQRADEPISIAALAEEIGVGLRSLQLSFREVHGMGPRQVLSRLRLERARDRLLRADPSEQVTTIALDCGFTHLSRFAEAYRQAFGERPRETLRRSA